MKKKIRDRIKYKQKIKEKYARRREDLLASESAEFALALSFFSIFNPKER